MKNDLLKKKKQRNMYTLTIMITVVCMLFLSFLSIIRNIPNESLIDENNLATEDIYANEDYYNEVQTISNANNASEYINDVLYSNSKGVYSSFEKLISFFNKIDSERTKTQIAKQSSINADQVRADLINGFVDYCTNNGIVISEKIATKVLDSSTLLDYETAKNSIKENFSLIQTKNVSSSNISDMKSDFITLLEKEVMDTEFVELGSSIVNAFLEVNSSVSVQETEQAKTDAYNNIIENYPVYIFEGDLLVKDGEIVSDISHNILVDMKLVREQRLDISTILEIIVIAILMLLLLFAYFGLETMKTHIDIKTASIVSIVCTVVFLIAFVLPSSYFIIAPVFLTPLLVTVLTNHKIALAITIPVSILMYFMSNGNEIYLAMILIGSILSIYFVKNTKNRLRFAGSGVSVGIICAVFWLAAQSIFKGTLEINYTEVAFIIVSGIISSAVALGFMPIFEGVFNIITPFKLLELSNPSKPLLNRLLQEAPGTYHHSLMVGNLAEAAIREIGGNSLLARVAAYYHDVGKLLRPEFFSENQTSGKNPHDNINPSLSVTVISNHTKDGDELAKKEKLPISIRNIIKEHHGTSRIEYFYNKALEAATNKEDIDENQFRYQGPRPQTREAAIVMLADVVEASVRSMANATQGEINGHIRKMINAKLEDNQLALCDLTLKDLDSIARAFSGVVEGYYHKRIKYPSQEIK